MTTFDLIWNAIFVTVEIQIIRNAVIVLVTVTFELVSDSISIAVPIAKIGDAVGIGVIQTFVSVG